MKKLIVATLLLAISLPTIAGSMAGGGGMAVVGENGEVCLLDLFENDPEKCKEIQLRKFEIDPSPFPGAEAQPYLYEVTVALKNVAPIFSIPLIQKMNIFIEEIRKLEMRFSKNPSDEVAYYEEMQFERTASTTSTDTPTTKTAAVLKYLDKPYKLKNLFPEIDLPFAPNLKLIRQLDKKIDLPAYVIHMTLRYGVFAIENDSTSAASVETKKTDSISLVDLQKINALTTFLFSIQFYKYSPDEFKQELDRLLAP